MPRSLGTGKYIPVQDRIIGREKLHQLIDELLSMKPTPVKQFAIYDMGNEEFLVSYPTGPSHK